MRSPLEFRCPQCKGSLETETDRFRCSPCEKSYPVTLGIPDFRLFVGPYAKDETTYKIDDNRHVMLLIEHFDKMCFAELLRIYLKQANVVGDRFTRMYENIV